jgi:creatinine amidohydrolase
METCWERLTPPDFRELVKKHKVCLLPIGSLERHGEHMPFGTDALICHTIAVGASKKEPCVVFPPYWFGQVHEAACFTGAINFSTRLTLEILEALLDQIAFNGFEKIVILNGHGGNSHMLEYLAMSQLDRKVDYTLYIIDRTHGEEYKHSRAVDNIWETEGGHACERETSVVMAIAPDTVNMEYQCFDEPIEPKVDLSHIKGVHTGLWWYAMYPEQVVGCPSKASPEKGKIALDAAILDIAEKLTAIKADTVVPALQIEFYDRCNNVRNE